LRSTSLDYYLERFRAEFGSDKLGILEQSPSNSRPGSDDADLVLQTTALTPEDAASEILLPREVWLSRRRPPIAALVRKLEASV
jgi:hypothetical protein